MVIYGRYLMLYSVWAVGGRFKTVAKSQLAGIPKKGSNGKQEKLWKNMWVESDSRS